MKYLRSVFSSCLIIVLFTIVSFIALGVPRETVLASANISVWWPVQNALLASTQPFKALVDNMPISDYRMFWQVDNGQLNGMDDNNTDYPHKEAPVNVDSWKWQSAGSYMVNFIAKDRQGNTIAEKAVAIRANLADASSPSGTIRNQTDVAISATPVPVSLVQKNSEPIAVVETAPILAASKTVNVWWPTEGANITGMQPFKAVLDGVSPSDYKMYWSVDNGQLNGMNDNNTDYAHKEASVDLSSWNWRGNGPYTLSFIAKDNAGNEIGRKDVRINTGGNTTVVQSPIQPILLPDPTPTPDIQRTVSSNPLSGLAFYVEDNSNAERQATEWLASRPSDAEAIMKIANNPAAKWLGDWNSDIYTDTKNYVDAAAAKDQTAVMIAYNIPKRDCGNYSAGGANSTSYYATWIGNIARAIGSRSAVVVLEPDAMTLTSCLSPSELSDRNSMIKNAVHTLKSLANTKVYIDAGHSSWIGAQEMSGRLANVGIDEADGFALNVSNYYANNELINYGSNLSSLLGGKHYIIDTSRNGLGSNGEWCNPSGRALGTRPTTNTGVTGLDAYLWLKSPGESDGTCNGGPSAGTWWPEYALGLSKRAAY